MAIRFEWDAEKDRDNRRRHRVSFPEAATALLDPLSLTILDPDHSVEEDRFVTVGPTTGIFSWSSILSAAPSTASSARVRRRGESDVTTKKKADEPRPEYDFRGGERGRYAKRAAQGYTITVHRKPTGSPPKGSRQGEKSAPDRVDPPNH